ncbi:MAG: DNA alkylation repair protein [Bacteroidales bacterium]|nr:DNA alkylation repair protein [Bacteroidales bacterium]
MDNVLLAQMQSHADPSQVAGLSRFFKTGPGQYGEGDKFLGIKVPVTREVVKQSWNSLSVSELEECIVNDYHEVRLAALLSLVEIFKHAGKRSSSKSRQTSELGIANPIVSSGSALAMTREDCVQFYLKHTDYINNWDLVDLSCYNILGEWLLDKDRTLLYDLARDGKTIWEQRIGMVSTMTFIRHGQLDDTFAIADILLHHPHDLIHKAVGWLLREAGKKDKHALEAYLLGPEPERQTSSEGKSQHFRYQTMPRTMLRYAIEKFSEAERQAYLSGKAE